MKRDDEVIAATRRWVERVVMRHNFCPFAHKPFREGRIRYAVCRAGDPEAVAEALLEELLHLSRAPRERIETTLLVTPRAFPDFHDYNDFLDVADALVEQLHLEGEIQIASFHPDYRFADLDPGDVRNYTNRSPYPTFHLIREASIDEARCSHPDVEGIPEANMARLQDMGLERARAELAACREEEAAEGTRREPWKE